MTLRNYDALPGSPDFRSGRTGRFPTGRPEELVAGRATPADAARIARLTRAAAPDTIPVDEAEAARRCDEFEVLRHPRFGVVAAAAVHPIAGQRAELRSVVVAPGWQGRGLGARLVRQAVQRTLLANRWLACVTLRPGFFAGLGFVEVPLDSLPDKPHRDDVIDGRRRVAMLWAPTARRAA